MDDFIEIAVAIGIMTLAFIDAPIQLVVVCSALYLGLVIRDSGKGR